MHKYKDKIKLIHVVNTINIGGMENGVINICNALDRKKFAPPIICCIWNKGQMADRFREDVKLVEMNFYGRLYPMYICKLFSLFRKEQADIVHTHGWGAGSLIGILAAKLARVPIIINGEHGSFFTKKNQLIIQKILFYLCDCNLSVSETLKHKYAEILQVPANKIKVIENGVDTDIFSGKYDCSYLRKELNKKFGIIIDDHSVVIGCIGSLKPEKNQVMLLKALREIKYKKAGKQIKAIFVGDGVDLPDLVRFVKDNGLERDVAFLGNRKDIPQLLSAMNIFISTSISRHEGMSNVILEAMSSSLPVIATKSIGTSELVRDGLTGFLAEQDDIIALADEIVLLCSDLELRKKMGIKAREIVKNKYSITEMVSNYEKVYCTLIKRKSRVPQIQDVQG